MEYKLKLKTGFYKTTNYTLCILKEEVRLIAEDSLEKDSIPLDEGSLNSITLIDNKNPAIEIQTHDKFFSGNFIEPVDLLNLHQELKECLKTKLFFEQK